MTTATATNLKPFANLCWYTDVDPYEVIGVVSDKCVVVRAMNATRDESVKLNFEAGGFAAHCSNSRDQKWFIESNPEGDTFRIRLHKDGRWYNKHGQRFAMSDTPRRYHDYNF